MLRTLVLLVAALAAIALAAPAPKPHRGVSGKASDGSRNFKSFSRGRHSKGHARNPRTELMRVYNKYHWSITLSPLDDSSSWLFDWPSSSSSGGGSDPYGSSPSEPIETASAASPYGYGPQSSFATAAASGMATASAASPDGYGTVAPVAPSAVMSSVGFETRTSASFAASATASISGGDGGDDSGEVTASPEENESEYLSPVSIAGQKLNLNFDTGSADLWVFSTSLSERQRGQHSAFDPTKSSTWQEYSGGSWEISYGDGSGAAGTVGFDQVDVGGVTATQQAVELATAISSAFVSDENNDGLLGLAFGKINTVQPQAQKTFFENVADELDEKLFTADLDIDASGTYEFGKLDTSKYSGELHTTPIDNSRGFWEFTSNTYSIDGQDTQNSNASPAIADTGTSLIMVDENVAEAYYSQIQGAQMDHSAGGYVYPCDAQVPSFGVQIGEGGFMAHLNGSDIEYARIGSNTCFGGVQGNGGQGLQIYGAVLLKQYFAVFNFGDETFGIAQKN